ncbi:MAG: hypothetical protein EOT05_02690 [Candidatus Microsaccharimonas sossegonensis]|uniref:Uncharacterized protein n=1 Tax=Candidatus Microsaccharimonas sossegonensis TaxID=2506948 RepID=A0A4Q0AHN9_9BACT|nr:MAG: hypothetical protein EOT05_02690 [Candidatus Microsaccharimonas sossegonensis]
MAEHHFVDPKDQHQAATGVEDHSDLTSFYAQPKKEVLGPWMQEKDRQAAFQADLDTIQTGLRKSSILIGLSLSLPIVLGILLWQLAFTSTVFTIAGPMLFVFIILGLILVIMTIIMFTWVGNRFQKNGVRALPVTMTTLLTVFLVLQPIFNLAKKLINGLGGYGVALALILVVSIVLATITIFIWTAPKIHPLVKVFILLAFVGIGAAIFYLA